jgi:hypothetical protein
MGITGEEAARAAEALRRSWDDRQENTITGIVAMLNALVAPEPDAKPQPKPWRERIEVGDYVELRSDTVNWQMVWACKQDGRVVTNQSADYCHSDYLIRLKREDKFGDGFRVIGKPEMGLGVIGKDGVYTFIDGVGHFPPKCSFYHRHQRDLLERIVCVEDA